MITSLIEMLQLPNFGHMTQYNFSCKINFFDDFIVRNYDVITVILKYLYLRRPGEVSFADITKIVTMFIKKIFECSKKLKGLEII